MIAAHLRRQSFGICAHSRIPPEQHVGPLSLYFSPRRASSFRPTYTRLRAIPMIGHSTHEYIFIRICIFGLRLLAPLSILYVAASLYDRRWIVHPGIGYYALLESAFYLLVYLPRSKSLQKVSQTARVQYNERVRPRKWPQLLVIAS